MASAFNNFKLKYHNFQFLNDVDRDNFLLADGVNASTKLLYRFLEFKAADLPILISNGTLMLETGLTEEAIKAELRRLENVGIITCLYEQEGKVVYRHNYDPSKRLFRKEIVLNLENALQYLNYTVYDEEYKTAPKRGLLRRIVRQFPIMIKGLVEFLIKKAQKDKNQELIKRYQKRQNNYHRHLKWHLKRHNRYESVPTDDVIDIDYDAVNEKLKQLGTTALPGNLISDRERYMLYKTPGLKYDKLTHTYRMAE